MATKGTTAVTLATAAARVAGPAAVGGESSVQVHRDAALVMRAMDLVPPAGRAAFVARVQVFALKVEQSARGATRGRANAFDADALLEMMNKAREVVAALNNTLQDAAREREELERARNARPGDAAARAELVAQLEEARRRKQALMGSLRELHEMHARTSDPAARAAIMEAISVVQRELATTEVLIAQLLRELERLS